MSFIEELKILISFFFHLPRSPEDLFLINSITIQDLFSLINWGSLGFNSIFFVTKKLKDKKMLNLAKSIEEENELKTLIFGRGAWNIIKRFLVILVAALAFYIIASFFAISTGGYSSLGEYLSYLQTIPPSPIIPSTAPSFSRINVSKEFFASFYAAMLMVISSNLISALSNIFKNKNIQTSFFSFIRVIWLAIPLVFFVSVFWPSAYTIAGIGIFVLAFIYNQIENGNRNIRTIIFDIRQDIKDSRNRKENDKRTVLALLEYLFSLDRIKKKIRKTKNIKDIDNNNEKPSNLDKFFATLNIVSAKILIFILFIASFTIVLSLLMQTGFASLFPPKFWRFNFFSPTLTLFDFTFLEYLLHQFFFALLPALIMLIIELLEYNKEKEKEKEKKEKLKPIENFYYASNIFELFFFRIFFYTTIGTMLMMLFTIYCSAVIAALGTAIMLAILTKLNKYGLSIQYEKELAIEMRTLTYEDKIIELKEEQLYSTKIAPIHKTSISARAQRDETKIVAKTTKKLAKMTAKTKRIAKRKEKHIAKINNIMAKEKAERELIDIMYKARNEIAKIKYETQEKIADIRFGAKAKIAKIENESQQKFIRNLNLAKIVAEAKIARKKAQEAQLASTDLVGKMQQDAAKFLKVARNIPYTSYNIKIVGTEIAGKKKEFLDKASREKRDSFDSAARERGEALTRIENDKVAAIKRAHQEKARAFAIIKYQESKALTELQKEKAEAFKRLECKRAEVQDSATRERNDLMQKRDL